jgi:hypothetical protein
MNLWDTLNTALAGNGLRLGLSWSFWGTGKNKEATPMNIKDPNFLLDVLCEVYDTPGLHPIMVNGELETHCNEAVQAILNRYNYHGLDGLNADAMCSFFAKSVDWEERNLADVQRLANTGVLVIGAATSTDLGQKHGHVSTVRPGNWKISGHWGQAPSCMNVGGENFIGKDMAYAVKMPPKFYALKMTLPESTL